MIRTTLQVATITWGAGGRVSVGTTPRRPRVNTRRSNSTHPFPLSLPLARALAAITLEPHCPRPRNHYATPAIPPTDGWATPTESLRHYGSYVGVHDCSLLLANFIYELDRMTIPGRTGGLDETRRDTPGSVLRLSRESYRPICIVTTTRRSLLADALVLN